VQGTWNVFWTGQRTAVSTEKKTPCGVQLSKKRSKTFKVKKNESFQESDLKGPVSTGRRTGLGEKSQLEIGKNKLRGTGKNNGKRSGKNRANEVHF